MSVTTKEDKRAMELLALGTECMCKNDLRAARYMFGQALALFDVRCALNDALVGELLMQIGNVHSLLGEYAYAQSHYAMAALVYGRVFGEDHINVGLAKQKANQAQVRVKAAAARKNVLPPPEVTQPFVKIVTPQVMLPVA